MSVNTEKPIGKAEAKRNAAVSTPKKIDKKTLEKAPVKEDKKVETPEKKTDEKKTDDPKTDEKKKVQPAKKIKKEFVVVNASSVPVSTKYAVSICNFIRYKLIDNAIADLEAVTQKRKSVPMKGEYAHKKDVSVASGAGKYPVNAAKQFIVLLKSLKGNANNHDVENAYVAEAIANKAAQPMGRFGRWSRKRTHIKLVAREKKENLKSKKNKMEKKK